MPISLNWTKITQPKMLRRGIQSFGTIDFREGRDCGSDLPIAIFDDPNNRGLETAPTRRPQSRDTRCLWESWFRDFVGAILRSRFL